MKKKKVILIAAAVACILLLLLCGLYFIGKQAVLLPFYLEYMWGYNAEFEEYDKEFELVRDYVQEEFGKEGAVNVHIGYDTESGGIYLSSSGRGRVDPPKRVEYALYVLKCHAFQYQNVDLNHIELDGEQVAFRAYQHSYALVWSPDKKPSDYFGEKTYAKEIIKGIGWYHVSEKS